MKNFVKYTFGEMGVSGYFLNGQIAVKVFMNFIKLLAGPVHHCRFAVAFSFWGAAVFV